MKKRKKIITDMLYVFKFVSIEHEVNTEYFDESEQKRISLIIDKMSREIMIDKSYVEYEGTKYEKCFITENGWNDLCKTAFETDFGDKANAEQKLMMLESFKCIICFYLYQILDDFGFDVSEIYLQVKDNSKFMIEYHIDNIKEWKRYPGKWQTW